MQKLLTLLLFCLPVFGQLKITTADIPNATVSSAYSTTFSASGGTAPYTWAVTSGTLPTGITLASNGTLSGTPTTAGWSDFFTIRVTDNVAATASLSYSFIVVPAVDTYGGLTSTSCAATGFFHNVKVGSRWWYCTPSGHLYLMFGISAISADSCTGTGTCVDAGTGIADNYGTIATAHYGDLTTNWSCGQIKRMKAWGFNIVGQQSAGGTNPITNSCNPKLPAISQIQMIYASNNFGNYWGTNGAVKDIIRGVGPVFTGYRAADMDVFDPNLPVGFHAFATALGYPTGWNSPYIVGTMGDDIDWLYAFAAGPDFPTTGTVGNTSPHPGYLTAISSPEQTYSNNSRGTKQLYAQRMVYAKAQALDPADCTLLAPCSWRDWLKDKYGTIGALNTAWGTSFTSFDSTGSRATQTIGTGDGMTTSFNFILSNTPVSPSSVYVVKNGSNVGGDCPWWNCAGASGTGSIESTDNTLVSGSPCYVSAPSFAAAGGPYPAATYWTACVYEYNDGSFGVKGGYQSISVAAGQLPIWGSPAGAGNITGWKSYGFCIVASGPAAFGCLAAGSSPSIDVFRLQASGLTIGVNWQLPGTGMVAGAAEPSIPGVITYSSGIGSIAFSTAPAAGQAIQIAYTYGGWMSGGTGVMDINGSETSLVGTNFYCLTPSRPVTGVCQGSSPPHDFPVPNANATFGADADEWVSHYSAKAHKIIRDEISATNPDAAFLSFDTLGAWGVPPRKEILQGAAPYSDGAYPAWAPPAQDVAGCCAALTYSYFDTYFSKPMFTATFIAATPDSFLYPFYGNSGSDKGTQELKGQFYKSTVDSLLNMQSTGGNYNWVGLVAWGWLDFWTDGGNSQSRTNWGLVSLNDNPYDGKSDCSVTRTDPLGFTTTAESNIPVWQASHAYAVDIGAGVYPTIQPTSGTRYIFRQLTGSGTSGGSQPTWCTTTGCTTNDNGITWTNLGPKASSTCMGDSVDYVKSANSLWFNLNSGSGSVGGGKLRGKSGLKGKATLKK